jgi:hypothetical protein
MTPRAFAILALCVLLPATACGDPDCREDGCDTNQVCDDVTGLCVAPPDKPNCVEMGCEGDLFCDAGSGACIERTRCLSPQGDCSDGNCTTCPEGLNCDARTGFCQPAEACRFVECAVAQQCNPQTLACEAIACALDPDCPGGSICSAQETCLAGCRNDGGCAQGSVCNIPVGTEAGSCTARCSQDMDCPWGERCGSADGVARCEPEPACGHTRDCREGEECRGGACLRPLCASDGDCAEGEFCLVDTGECASADCSDDAFEPNDMQSPWPLARGRYEGLTVCRGKDDWYSVSSRGTQPLRLTLSHGRDADLDIQVFQSGLLIGEAANDGALSVVQIPAAIDGELLVRIFPARGVSTSYLLFVENGQAVCEEEASEPNDRPDQAARLRPGTPAVFSTCANDVDFVALGGDAGAARLTVVPLGQPQASWDTSIASDSSVATALPVLDTGVRELNLAWINPAARPVLRSASAAEMQWNVVYQVMPTRCEDAVRGNHNPDRAVPVESESVVQGTICPEDTEPGAPEPDWFEIVVPEDEAAQITVRLTTDEDGPFPAAPLKLELFAGPSALPWRSGLGEGNSLVAIAQISVVDRPVYARVQSSAAFPDLLSSWPTYDLSVATAAAPSCVDDRSEGGGNDTPATAIPLTGPIRAILCPADVDIYVLGDFVPAGVGVSEGPMRVSTLSGDADVLRTVNVGERLELSEGFLDGAAYLRLDSETVSSAGLVYELLGR